MNTPRVSSEASSVKRRYSSALREAQAHETRRGIVAAAARLFVEDGFGPTTVDAVAQAAGVSRKTVFTAVGGKAELLGLAIDWAIAGDDEPVAVVDRPSVRELLHSSDPVALLHKWAHVLVDIDARVAPLAHALDTAADADDAAAALRDTLHRQRLDGAELVVARLADIAALRDDLSRREAVDLAWLASDPALYDGLVRRRGWTAKRFEKWLAEYLVDQISTDIR